MKQLLLLFLLISSLNTTAQLLQGYWKGSFSQKPFKSMEGFETRIDLEFILNPDTSYSVYSHTHLSLLGTAICKVYYEKLSKDSIYLEEVEDTTRPGMPGLQAMYLKIVERDNTFLLKGVWKYPGSDEIQGEMVFRRSKKKEVKRKKKKD